MVHLLRSLFFGYALALAGAVVALSMGVGPIVVTLGVWFGGSALSVAFAATFTAHAGTPEPVVIPAQMQGDVSARELALWDADLAAEAFESDLQEERMASEDAERKTG